LGQFDGLDTEVLTLKGGEVVSFTSVVATSATDKAASDAFDGYVWSASRAVVTRNLATSTRPLMLADDGITGYGTLFGTVVGGTVGQQVTGGAVLGPHTATGSGKVTCWDKQGLYAVSLDACDPSTTDGLQPTYALATGTALTYAPTAAAAAVRGYLTPVGSALANSNTTVVGRFVEFVTNGSLVTTPNYLVAALNSPSGNVTSVSPKSFAFAVFSFNPDH
jgi:hypothetical protein